MPWYSQLPAVKICLAEDPEFSCSLPDTFESDGDIGGVGVVSAFMAAACLTLIAAVAGLSLEGCEYFYPPAYTYAKRMRDFVDVFLISLGDTQIVTSIALLMTANFAVGCTISAYHYDLVCKLVLISSAAHIGSMAFVHGYFGRSKFLGGIRVSLIVMSLIFGWRLLQRRSSSNIFPIAKPNSNANHINGTTDTGLVLPASCFIEHPGDSASTSHGNFTATQYWNTNVTTKSSATFGGTNSSASSLNGTTMPRFQQFSSNDELGNHDVRLFFVMTFALGLTILASALLHCFRHFEEHKILHRVAYILRCVSFFVIYGVMLYGFITFLDLWFWMGDNKWFADDDDGESTVHSFGQLMPLILLILPFISLFEEGFGKKKSSEDDDGRSGSTSSHHPLADYGDGDKFRP